MEPLRGRNRRTDEEQLVSLDSYLTLGRSGLRVSPLCRGTMTFGEDLGWGSSVADCERILAAYLDRGGNFLDTANAYTNGHSEKIIGDFFAAAPSRRHHVVIGTKFFVNLFSGDPNGGGAGRKAVVRQCEESLRRLQTDYLDLYWLHNWDRSVPIEETVRALDDLVTAGKVRYVGFSDIPAWKVAEAQTIAHFRSYAPIVALQLEYSLLARTVEGEQLPMAAEMGLGVMPWSPLKNGFLSGKYRRATAGSVESSRRRLVGPPSDEDYDVIESLAAVADEIGASPAAVALAWVMSRTGVSSTLIGARSLEQLESNLGAFTVKLSAEQLAILDMVSAPTLGFPHDYNKTAAVLAFPGMTVDGRANPMPSLLGASPARY
jgi:aryl-alcohol dehydrogenase-like predicted oxidoreductase